MATPLLATVASQNRVVLPKEVTKFLRASAGAELQFIRAGRRTAVLTKHSHTHGHSSLPTAVLQARRRLTLPFPIVEHIGVVPGDLILFEIPDAGEVLLRSGVVVDGVMIAAADVKRRR